MRHLWQLWRQELGADLAEYALIIGLIALGGMGGFAALGGNVDVVLGQASHGIQAHTAIGGGKADSNNDVTYQDDFEDKDGLKWVRRGKWKHCDGAFCGKGRWDYAVAGDPTLRDYDYSLRLRSDKIFGHKPWNGTRVVFRFHDPHNYYAIVPGRNGIFELAKMENGKWRPALATARSRVNIRQWQNYRVVVTGNTITAYLNGKQMLRYVDPHPIASGRFGVINDNSRGRFDNVIVRPVNPSIPSLPPVHLMPAPPQRWSRSHAGGRVFHPLPVRPGR